MKAVFDARRFLRTHWQKKPLLVRNAFPGFVDPIAPDELAGLSCEDGVESRIVREKGGKHPWEVTWGPHPATRFRKLPEKGWTILVQEVNRWVPEAALLLEPFSFVPNVRVDDVMVSYATPGGSVGAHVDSYDVFLLQGRGQRRWKWGTKPVQHARFREGLDLRILQSFAPDEDETLGPGDMLYLPPGFAHHGVAVTECLTWSIGFRAPRFGEMWKDFASHRPSEELLEDPRFELPAEPGAIPEAMRARVRAAIRALDTSDEAIDRWFASFATRLKPGHEMTAGTPTSQISRSEEGRFAFLERKSGLFLYVGGEEIEVPAAASTLAKLICSKRRFDSLTAKNRAEDRSPRDPVCDGRSDETGPPFRSFSPTKR